jgi:hypothetical protein
MENNRCCPLQQGALSWAFDIIFLVPPVGLERKQVNASGTPVSIRAAIALDYQICLNRLKFG